MVQSTRSDEFQRAVKLHQADRLDEAEALYRSLLRADPRHGDTLNLLGVLVCQKGDLASGRSLIEKAIAIRPTPAYYVNLSNAHRQIGDLDAAFEAMRAARDLAPNNPDNRLQFAGELHRRGMLKEALAEYREAIDLRPSLARAHCDMGILLQALGRIEEAMGAWRVAIEFDPGLAEAYYNLAAALVGRDRMEEALTNYRAAAERNPKLANVHADIGGVLQELGRIDEALEALRKAVAADPDSFSSLWRFANGHLPLVYRSRPEMEASRAAYTQALGNLAAKIETWSDDKKVKAAEGVGSTQPYYLPYQGHNDRDLQRTYGAMIHGLMAARMPAFAARPTVARPKLGEKIRVGFASAYFLRHSNWKIPLKGWVENLDRSRFEVFGYHLGVRRDAQTEDARKSMKRFETGPYSLDQWARVIHDDNLHALIYPEIGMNAMALKLAALRLAPMQASSWGHPQTSGLPTIDYFLSSDLMEGPEADTHYSEKLVRLPNLSIHYEAPETGQMTLARADIGVPDDAVLYWCCQSLFKYLPDYDSIFARIAQRVGKARFVFIRYRHGPTATGILQERLTRAFADRGLSARDHCVFLPMMDFSRFNAVARLADVYLDTIQWSGCNSLLESLTWSLPPVILPGAMMRGRHAAAIMAMMGVTETIAGSLDGYVDVAARLGLDRDFRTAVAGRIAANKHKIYQDMESVRGLERFLEGVVELGVEGYAPPPRSPLAQDIDKWIPRADKTPY